VTRRRIYRRRRLILTPYWVLASLAQKPLEDMEKGLKYPAG
jgi:hypothetical protein